MSLINIVMAQINPVVGYFEANTLNIIACVKQAEAGHQADAVVFPELAICGYPPEDLLFRESLHARVESSLSQLAAEVFSSVVIVGYPKRIDGNLYNMVGVLSGGEWIAEYAKQNLPNYQVFDEKRYFTPGSSPCVFDLKGVKVGLSICEDIWHDEPLLQAKEIGAQLLISVNASPFHREKHQKRLELLSYRAQQGEMPIVYVNQVGGQDELVFDGGSFAVDASGQCQVQAPLYQEGLYGVQCEISPAVTVLPQANYASSESALCDLGVVYQALVLGLRDYTNKNHFKDVILGLSGGIDSALTLAIAVDALGAERVHAVMMPFL